jgi:hypothetical protein
VHTPELLLDIVERTLHGSRSEWMFLRELKLGTGRRNGSIQRLDGYALNCLPHTAMKRVCYEVKCSRADFLAELKHHSNDASACGIRTNSSSSHPLIW